ncbi:hypothetical protein BaRGS_00013685 [Batillaria attramentaria]|uniref:Uncharacterized protein n=1 Tax=Batillaria attramentaria TaxID=370345 RepID=A0ABD0L712_9CAEN
MIADRCPLQALTKIGQRRNQWDPEGRGRKLPGSEAALVQSGTTFGKAPPSFNRDKAKTKKNQYRDYCSTQPVQLIYRDLTRVRERKTETERHNGKHAPCPMSSFPSSFCGRMHLSPNARQMQIAVIPPHSRLDCCWPDVCIRHRDSAPDQTKALSVRHSESSTGQRRFLSANPQTTATGSKNRVPIGCFLCETQTELGSKRVPNQTVSRQRHSSAGQPLFQSNPDLPHGPSRGRWHSVAVPDKTNPRRRGHLTDLTPMYLDRLIFSLVNPNQREDLQCTSEDAADPTDKDLCIETRAMHSMHCYQLLFIHVCAMYSTYGV